MVDTPPLPIGRTSPRTDDTQRIISVIDFDALYRQTANPIILNRFDFGSPGYTDRLQESIFSRASDIDFVARCECEYLQGTYFENQNAVCPKCHTVATADMEAILGHLNHKAWIACPEQIPGGWLNPIVYNVLSRWLRYEHRNRQKKFTNTSIAAATKTKPKKGNYLDDILDVTTPIPEDLQGIITGKGFGYLRENFDFIIDFFAHHFAKTKGKPSVPTMLYFLQENKDRLFCHYIPILSSALHPIVMSEGQGEVRKRYVDASSQFIQSATTTLSALAFATNRKRRPDEVEAATFSAYQNLMAYHEDISYRQISIKRSIPRMHIFGSRLHFSARCVIVPINEPHQFDDLHFPWSAAVNLLRVHILGRLIYRQGMPAGEAMRLQQAALSVYDPMIDQMMKDFIKESGFKGLPGLFNRNPTIRNGSIQLYFVTKIKSDPLDESIGFPAASVSGFNADRPSVF